MLHEVLSWFRIGLRVPVWLRVSSLERSPGSGFHSLGRAEAESSPLSHQLSLQALHDHGHALAAADAHRLEAERFARVLERVEEGRHDAGAGLAERVAERDGAALDVELVPADAEVL